MRARSRKIQREELPSSLQDLWAFITAKTDAQKLGHELGKSEPGKSSKEKRLHKVESDRDRLRDKLVLTENIVVSGMKEMEEVVKLHEQYARQGSVSILDGLKKSDSRRIKTLVENNRIQLVKSVGGE